MGSTAEKKEDKDCELKHRIIPKLTAQKENGTGNTEDETKKETTEERLARISNVKISFSDFFVKCIDHEMLKLFFGLLLAFLILVGLCTCMYLVFIFFFKPSMWNLYFPSEEFNKKMQGEL